MTQPESGELVVVTVHDLHANSVSVTLDEYSDRDGMIHISEVSRSWVRDLKDHVQEGEKTVAQVLDVDDDTVNLSLKRVNDKQKRDKMEDWNKEEKAQDFLHAVAETADTDIDTVQENVGNPFKNRYGNTFTGFEQVLIDEDEVRDLIDDGDLFTAVKDVAENRMSTKNVKMETEVEVSVPTENGLQAIKDALTLDTAHAEVRYVTAPKYKIQAWGINQEACKDAMNKAMDSIQTAVEDAGGTVSFTKKK